MKIIITINMDNDAFSPYPESEMAKILERYAMNMRQYGIEELRIKDTNGNTCGNLVIEDD